MPLGPPPTIASGLNLITQPLKHALSNHVCEVTYAVVQSPGDSAQDVVNDCQDAWNTTFALNMDADVTMLPPRVLQGNGTTVPLMATATGASIQGSNIQTSPPAQVATVFRKRTAFGGRANRGRFYVPWMTADSQVDEAGNIAPSVASTWDAVGALLLSHLAAQDATMVIANKTIVMSGSPPKPHVTAITTGAAVTSLTADRVVGTQRRRLR